MRDNSTDKLLYLLGLKVGDTAEKAFTKQVKLAIFNLAQDEIILEAPVEMIGNLYVRDYAVTMTDGAGNFEANVLKVVNARQAAEPQRNADIVEMPEYDRRSNINMLQGTFSRPLLGVDYGLRLVKLDSGNYSGNVVMDYVEIPVKLRIHGQADEHGVIWDGVDVDPQWTPQLAPVVLKKAVAIAFEVRDRSAKENSAEEFLSLIARRLR